MKNHKVQIFRFFCSNAWTEASTLQNLRKFEQKLNISTYLSIMLYKRFRIEKTLKYNLSSSHCYLRVCKEEFKSESVKIKRAIQLSILGNFVTCGSLSRIPAAWINSQPTILRLVSTSLLSPSFIDGVSISFSVGRRQFSREITTFSYSNLVPFVLVAILKFDLNDERATDVDHMVRREPWNHYQIWKKSEIRRKADVKANFGKTISLFKKKYF